MTFAHRLAAAGLIVGLCHTAIAPAANVVTSRQVTPISFDGFTERATDRNTITGTVQSVPCQLNVPNSLCKSETDLTPEGSISRIFLKGLLPTVTHNQTTSHIARFEFFDSGAAGASVAATVSGLIRSRGTVATSILPEAWVAFGVKVEVYESTDPNFIGATLIGGASAVSEGCSTVVPNTLELFEPCRNVFSNDVPVTIPVTLTEGLNYAIVVTTSCDTQGPEASCYSTEFIDVTNNFDIFNTIETIASDFAVTLGTPESDSGPDPRIDVAVSSRASQFSVDELRSLVQGLQSDLSGIETAVDSRASQDSVNALQNSVDTLQGNVDALQASVDSALAALAGIETLLIENGSAIANNDAQIAEVIRLLKLPFGQAKKQ